MWNVQTGLWAALILLTTTRFAWLGRVGRIDQPLCLVLLASMAFFWDWIERNKSAVASDRDRMGRGRARALEAPSTLSTSAPLSYAVYVLLAAGILLKGPVAVIFFFVPVLSFLFFAGFPVIPKLQPGWWQTWRGIRAPSGLLLTIALSAPWFIAASIATNGEFFWSFFVYHNVERALGTSEALKAGPVWFYIPRLLVDAFPWSLLYPAMWLWLWRSRDRWLYRPADDATAPADLRYVFLFTWAVSLFTFLSLVSFKRADYLLPIYPAMALILAGWLGERTKDALAAWDRRPLNKHRRYHRIILASAAVLAVTTIPLLMWGGVEFHKKGIVHSLLKIGVLRDHLNETDLFMIENVERLMQQNWTLLAIGGLFVVGSVWLLQTGWHQGGPRRILVGMAAPWLVGFMFQVHVLLPALDPLREMSRFAKAIRTIAGPDGSVHYFGKFDSDLAYHVGRPARDIDDWEQMVALEQTSQTAFVVIKAEQIEWVRRDPRMAHWDVVLDNRDLAFGGHRDHRLLITNRPAAVASRLDGIRSRW
jgi:4-amino-4-deoxy-L-arabinose transferase-like glycosyltransferase